MLNRFEKAYCAALLALREKNYRQALGHFEVAAPHFERDTEFNVLRESVRLLLAVKEELAGMPDGEAIATTSADGETSVPY